MILEKNYRKSSKKRQKANNHQQFMTTNCVKVITSINCPLLRSSNYQRAQLKHIYVILKAQQRKNETEVKLKQVKKNSHTKTEKLLKHQFHTPL